MRRANRLAFFLLAGLCFLAVPRIAVAAPERPVVVIPGILGSKLCKQGTTTLVWGGTSSLANLGQLALSLDSRQAEPRFEVCGIMDAVRIVGPFKYHQYDSLLETLRGFGYVDGKTLFVFAYDWRRSNFESAKTLSAFVRQHVGDRQFDIVAHSMGGLIARIYLKDLHGSDRVVRLVTMGTPHRGSLKVLRIADSGWSWWENAMAGGLTNIRETLMTFPSVYELLPSYADCCIVRGPGENRGKFDPFSIAFWESLALMPDRFRTPSGHTFLRRALDDAYRMHELMKMPIPQPVKLVPLVSGVVQTEWRVSLDPKRGTFVDWETSFGDGTVYERSAANMALFDARPSEVEHQRIFASDSARQVLRWALLSGIDPTAGPLVTQYRATIKAGPNGIDIALVQLSVAPDLLKAGSRGEVVLRITGKKALGEFDFPVTLVLHGTKTDERLQTTPSTVDIGGDFSTERTFRASFTAPAQAGTYSVSAEVPGLEALEELFEVMP